MLCDLREDGLQIIELAEEIIRAVNRLPLFLSRWFSASRKDETGLRLMRFERPNCWKGICRIKPLDRRCAGDRPL